MRTQRRLGFIAGFILLACFAAGYPTSISSPLSEQLEDVIPRSDNDCTTHKTIIRKLILWNLFAFLAVLFLGNRRFGCWGPLQNPSDAHTIDFDTMSLIFKLGGEIAKTYGQAAITRPADAQIWKYFQLWAVRPRATPLIMFLGYRRGWTGAALYSFIVDTVVCLIAVQFVGTASMVSGDFEADKGSWPTYRIGAVISIVPLIFFVIVGLAMFIFIVGTAMCLPCMVCLACCKLFQRGGEREPLTMDWETKDYYTWYSGYVALFITMYVGRWMMWSGIPLELWCPVMAGRVDTLMGLGPFAIQIGMIVMDEFSSWVLSG